MEGFGLRDSPDFEIWQLQQNELFQRELAGALRQLVSGCEERGDFAPAIGYARRWLALDSLSEEAHSALMRLYARDGQRNAALRQYRECVRILDQELGVAPLEETNRLYQAILERHFPPAAEPALSASRIPEIQPAGREPQPLSIQPAWPLVGRGGELAALQKAFHSAAARKGGFFALVGEAGIGKTFLAETFLSEVRRQGGLALVGRCYPGEVGLAYSSFQEALRAGLDQLGPAQAIVRLKGVDAHWLGEASRLLPDLVTWLPGVQPASPFEGPAAQGRFFEGLRQVLAGLSRLGPAPRGSSVVLFLDDLQWADNATLDLLAYLVRRIRSEAILILAAWREEGSPAERRLNQMMAEARRAGTGTLLALARLNPQSVAELVRSLQAMPREVESRLQREAEGLPFFVVEYIKALGEGQIDPAEADWRLPGSIRDLLQARLLALTQTEQQLLGAAAILGRSFDFETLLAVSGRSEEELVEGLEGLLGHGLIGELRAGPDQPRYDFNHDKLRALVYEGTSLARRRLLHHRAAETLLAQARRKPANGPLASQIAHHFHLSGQDERAAEFYFQAGQHSRSLFANQEALESFRQARALGYPDSCRVDEAIGDLQTLLGDYTGALSSYEMAAALHDQGCPGPLEHKLGRVHARRGAWEAAEQCYIHALEVLGDETPAGEKSLIYADWSQAAYQRGQPQRAAELAQKGLALAESAEDPAALAQALNGLGILARSQGSWEEARCWLERSLKVAEEAHSLNGSIAALNNLSLVYGDLGDLEQAISAARWALSLCDQVGDRHRQAAIHNNLADLLHRAKKEEEALDQLKQAVILFQEIEDEGGKKAQPEINPEIWKLTEW